MALRDRSKSKVFFTCLIVCFAISLCIPGVLFSQNVSEKKEIAIFNLSYYDWAIPQGALGAIDEEIRSVFINIGRFEVIGLNYRLGQNDVNEFIQKIRELKEANIEIPEEVLMGQEAFTEADLNRLIGTFIVIIPSVTYYNQETQDDGDIETTLKTSFTFINIDEMRTIGQFFVETTGYDESPRESAKEATEGIPSLLTFEIRKMPEFQIQTGIIEIDGRDIYMEFGNNMGVKVGDEYVVVQTEILSTGYEAEAESALMVVKEVQNEFSIAQLLFTKDKPNIGDQLREVPRFGVDFSPYAQMIVSPDNLIALLGINAAVSRGFFSWRPAVGVELPLQNAWLAGFGILPLNVYGGAEVKNIYLRRIKVSPTVFAGISTVIPYRDLKEDLADEINYFSHIGGKAQVTISYLLNKNLRAYGEAGFAYWFGLLENAVGSGSSFNIKYFDSYGGPYLGGGITWKY